MGAGSIGMGQRIRAAYAREVGVTIWSSSCPRHLGSCALATEQSRLRP
jgi:hypothetical protein